MKNYFLISLFLLGCTTSKIDSVKVYYSNEDFTSITAVRCGDLSYIAGEWMDSLIISDDSFFKELDSELSKLTLVDDSVRQLMPRLDTRVEAYIYYKESKRKLLCLDQAGDIVFDDKTWEESRSLIDLIYSNIE